MIRLNPHISHFLGSLTKLSFPKEKIIPLAALLFYCQIFGMEANQPLEEKKSEQATVERLGKDVHKEIVQQILRPMSAIGKTPSNEFFLCPETIKGINALSRTDHYFHDLVNSNEVTLILINKLTEALKTLDQYCLPSFIRNSTMRPYKSYMYKDLDKTVQLCAAAYLGTPGAIEWLKEQQKDEATKKHCQCILNHAIDDTKLEAANRYEGKEHLIRSLLKTDIDINDSIFPALYQPTIYNNIRTLKAVLHHPNINLKNENLNELILAAAEKSDVETLSLFLQLPNININCQDKFGNTPLMHAINRKEISNIELLLDQPSLDVTLTNNQDKTAFELAKENVGRLPVSKDPEILKLIDEYTSASKQEEKK